MGVWRKYWGIASPCSNTGSLYSISQHAERSFSTGDVQCWKFRSLWWSSAWFWKSPASRDWKNWYCFHFFIFLLETFYIGPLDSLSSNVDAPPVTSTQLVLSVSNSPVDPILSLKKKKKRRKINSSTSTEFSLPYTTRSIKRKQQQAPVSISKRARNSSNDNVFK